MRFKLVPDNLMERIALWFNLAPTPLLDTQMGFTLARAIMAGAELGVYEALGKGSLTAEEIAARCKTHPAATRQLIDCLVGIRYLGWSDGRYTLKPRYRKWLLKEYPSNLIGKLRFQTSEWNWMAYLEDYVRSGKPMDMHANLTPPEWASYQEGMRDLSVNTAEELAGKLKLPAGAKTMLDIGGSHGLYSVGLCKKNPGLSSTILELPGAIDRASAIAAEQGLTDRVKYRAGNALTDDLGEAQYDLIMINNVVHHFTPDQNRQLAQKVARAMKPGGLYSIGEFIRGKRPGDGGAVASGAGLYFSLTSESGTWSVEEMQSWQKEAGLEVRAPIGLMTLPGWKSLPAAKP
jgi:2-polyprenyl-3-methyl-5-hydroxy-6-metoxy-1,4-benzoquinol methylase